MAKIKILNCNAQGKQFGNLTKGSIHEVIKTPEGIKETLKGVWVMGVGEPVKLLINEYQRIE